MRQRDLKFTFVVGEGKLAFDVVGCGGLWTTDTGSPIVIRGKDKLAEHAVWSLKCFPDWEWYNIKVFETDDPNHFWVECDGHGKILFPGYPEGYYENHFLHSFELDDGKIKRNREFMNVFQQLRAAVAWPIGLPPPSVRITVAPASAVPAITLPLLGSITGAAGATESTVVLAGPLVLPAASWATALTTVPLDSGVPGVKLQLPLPSAVTWPIGLPLPSVRITVAYWTGLLGGEQPVLELPFDRPRPARQSHRGAQLGFELSRELVEAVRALAQREGTSSFMLLLASFQALLYRYSGQADIRVGVPIANRNRVETERLIGFFDRTVPFHLHPPATHLAMQPASRLRHPLPGLQRSQRRSVRHRPHPSGVGDRNAERPRPARRNRRTR